MKSFKKLSKLGLFLIPTGTLAYFSSNYYLASPHPIHNANDQVLSDYFKQYIQENNLITPSLYKNYQRKYRFDHFFEKGVLKDLEGIQDYHLLIPKDYFEKLTAESQMSKEEKLKLHSQAKIHCTFTPNSKLQGNLGYVHGGFTTTLLDNLSGCFTFMLCDFSPAVTAYLNVNYNKPMPVDEEYVTVIEVEKIEGRKVFLKGKIMDKENNVYTTMDTLFVKIKWDNFYMKQLYKSLLLDKETPDNGIPKGQLAQASS